MNQKNVAFAAAVASMFLASPVVAKEMKTGKKAEGEKITCEESNNCAGHGSCGGVGGDAKEHSCKGKNGCAGNKRSATSEECSKMGGKVVASK